MYKIIDEKIEELAKELKRLRLSLVTAESCTGGGMAYFITQNEKSSSFLERGFITYSNQAKTELLDVKPHTLQTFGPVSKETALEMAEGALKNSKAQVGISLTGLAGPDAETPHKKKGVLWIGLSGIEKPTQTQCYTISGTRKKFSKQCILNGLEAILEFIKISFH